MTKELESKLIEKYPILFSNKNKSPKESLMCFGCEHDDGWFDILDNLCGYIVNLCKNRSTLLKLKEEFKTPENHGYYDFSCPKVIFDQVKEKYGTLRVYWHFKDIENYEILISQLEDPNSLDKCIGKYSDMIENAVDFSEYRSSITCEITGKPGKLYSDGWCVTLCKEEAIKRFGFDPDEEDEKVEKANLLLV